MTEVKPLRKEYAELHAQAEKLIELATNEKRDLTDEEKKTSDDAFARMATIKEIEGRKAKLAEFAFSEKKNVELPSEPEGKEEAAEVEIKVGETFDAKRFNQEKFARAINMWLATGTIDRQFANITTASQSGALLPKEVLQPVIPSNVNVFREAFAVHGQNITSTPTTHDMSVPVMSATAGGEVSETASSETENAPSLSESITLNVKTYQSGSVWFSAKQIAAVDYDLMGDTIPALVFSKELGVESAAIAAIIADAGITQSVATSTTTGFTYGNLVSLNRKLPKKFDALKVIVLSKDAFTAAENLQTSTGYPVLTANDPQNLSLKYFNGTPVLRSDYLDNFGASKTVGFVMSLIGFRFRDASGTQVQRYTQNQARPGATGMNLYGFHGWGYCPSAMATLETPAS